jgi:proteic killer suppression protein
VIRSFAGVATRLLWETGKSRRLSGSLGRTALRKLLLIHAAGALADLRVPPGNRLEQLKGDREGQHSIRVNDQYRICFVWKEDGAYEVDIVDYH